MTEDMRLNRLRNTDATMVASFLLGGLLGFLHSAPTVASDFDTLHRMVLPQDNELKWVSVPWLTSITQARHRAAVEGKPLFVFADTGAGFADALGLC